ncbi:MAG: DUF1097 domain-containing protein, partial [bacterium]|nr:DUF1097 domain-containing protein [bacterium]
GKVRIGNAFTKMKFVQLLPVATAIALTAAIYVLTAQYFQVNALWLPFISWALYFIVGGKPSFLPKEIAGLTGGMLFGYLTLLAVVPIASLVGEALSMPIAVFLAAFSILLLELIDLFDMIPAHFFSYTSYFAYFFGGFGGEGATSLSIIPEFWILLMVGLGLGFFTAELRKKILGMQGVQEN